MKQKYVQKENKMKAKAVNDLAEEIKKAKTLMIVSIKGLPSKQFQDIKKTIRDSALVRVAKRNIMTRVLKELGNEAALGLEKYIKENSAFVISDIDGYELAGILATKKNPIFAKAGQIAPNDIEVKEGPTDLVPGPAISELGALGIQIAVEDGKIAIKASKVVVREGKEISAAVASLLQKLNIQPFSIGLDPVAVYDVKEGKIYTEIKIDPEGAVAELKSAAGKALGFAQKIVYYCKETIGYLLAKANAGGEALGKLEPSIEEKSAEKAEEAKEESKEPEEKKEETEPAEEPSEEKPVNEEVPEKETDENKEDIQNKSEETA
jgi:large subunit ribosomal protein L10